MFFQDVQRKAGHRFTVGQLRNAIPVAGNAGKRFNMAVPGRKVFVAYRPVYGKAIAGRPFKIKLTPALCLPGP